jgi:xyloglucan-specific exo-beta-1,4-glucanase
MVAALNSWSPDGRIWRSTDSGATWSPLWAYPDNANRENYYSWDTSLAPWLSGLVGGAQVGWMMEALVIDPFDSDHWLYGTGASIWGGHDLTNWDTNTTSPSNHLRMVLKKQRFWLSFHHPLARICSVVLAMLEASSTLTLTRFHLLCMPIQPFSIRFRLDYAGNTPSTLVRLFMP